MLAVAFGIPALARAQSPTETNQCRAHAESEQYADSLLSDTYWSVEGHEIVLPAEVIRRLRRVVVEAPLTEQRWRRVSQLTHFFNLPDSAVALAQTAVQEWPTCPVGRTALAQAQAAREWQTRRRP